MKLHIAQSFTKGGAGERRRWRNVSSKAVILFVSGIISGGALFIVDKTSPWYGVLQSFFAGFVFWIVFSFIPEVRQRNVVYTYVRNSYRRFRLNVATMLIDAGCFNNFVKVEDVIAPEGFRAFFSQRDEAKHCDYLERSTNAMRYCDGWIKDLKIEFGHFSDDVDYALNNLSTRDLHAVEALSFLKRRLSDITQKSCYVGDQMKYIDNFIWEIMGMWSDVKGELPSDWIADAIEALKR